MERLGEVSVPSGTLTILDPGHIGMYLAEEIPAVPVVRVEGLPKDRTLAVVGVRVGKGRWAQSWDHVAVVVANAPVASSEEAGEAMVDFARLMVADSSTGEHWVHDDSIDGQADFVFWGRDAGALARATGAPDLGNGQYGWRDQPIDEVVERGTAVEELMEKRRWKLATDFRPHSHHWALLEQVRASSTESGTITIAESRVCLFMTSWGDGLFPIFVDRAADGSLVRVRLQLRTDDSVAAMETVNS